MGKKKKDVVEAEVPATVASETNPETAAQTAVADVPGRRAAKKKMPRATGLFSSEKGSIACAEHTPIRGSDTWRFDRWRPMTADDVQAFERELGQKIACETCAALKRRAEAEQPDVVESLATEHAVPDALAATDELPAAKAVGGEPEPAKKKGRKAKADLALATFCEHYLTHLAESGKSMGTVFSYRLELKTALDALGAETKLGDLAPAQVLLFFGSDKVNKTRTGKPKSPLSISKTQRVLRLALVWAEEKGWIEKAPLPEKTATH
jgi:hypothetical protein